MFLSLSTRCAAITFLVCFEHLSALPAADQAKTTAHKPLAGLVPAPRSLPGIGRWQLAHKTPRGRIYSVAWSPDGKKIAYTEGMYIRICDAQAFKTERFLVGHAFQVTSIAWNWATNRIASAGCDGTVHVWSADGVPERVLKSSSPEVNYVAWTKNGDRLASAGRNGKVEIWEADGSLQRAIAASESAVNCVTWSPDGSHLVTGDDRYQLKIWNANGTLEHLCEGHLAPVTAVDWSPNGKRIASAALGFQPEENGEHLSELRLWNSDGSFIGTFTAADPLCGLQWNPNGQSIVSIGESGQLNFVGVDAKLTSTQRATFVDSRMSVPPLAFSPNGKEIVIGSSGSIGVVDAENAGTSRQSSNSLASNRRPIELMAIDSNREHVIVRLPTPGAGCKYRSLTTGFEADAPEEVERSLLADQSFNPAGDRYAFVPSESQLSIWNPRKKAVDQVTHSATPIVACAHSPLDDRIAYCDNEGTVRVMRSDGASVAELRAKKPFGTESMRVQLRWSDDGRAIVICQMERTGGRIEVRPLDKSAGATFDFGASFDRFWVSPDLRQAVTSTGSIEITKVQHCLSDGSTATELKGLPTDVDCFDCSPNFTQFTLGRDSGEWQLRRLSAPSTPAQEILAHMSGSCMAAVFSPDAKRVATGGWDAIVKIWKLDGTLERTLYGNTHPVYKVWWSRDGKRLVSSSRNGTLCRWRVDEGTLESLFVLNAEANPVFIAGNGQIPLSDIDDAAQEFIALVENPNGSVQTVEYMEFLKRAGQSTE